MYIVALKRVQTEVVLKKAIDQSISQQQPAFDDPTDAGNMHPERRHVIPLIWHVHISPVLVDMDRVIESADILFQCNLGLNIGR